MSNAPARVALDSVSKQIIEQLQLDGRKPYAAIAKAVGLSEAAVRQRVQKLTDAEITQIVAVTDPLMLGFGRLAQIGIKVTGDVTHIADRIAEIPEVSYLLLTAGSFDLMAEVVCADDRDLIRVLNQKIRAIDGVVETETFVYLEIKKQKYDWGTR